MAKNSKASKAPKANKLIQKTAAVPAAPASAAAYSAVALAVRGIVFQTASAPAMAQFGISQPSQIPGIYNLGLPAPIGMAADRITLMLPSLNKLILQQRADGANTHSITISQLAKTKTVGDLIGLTWGKIQET